MAKKIPTYDQQQLPTADVGEVKAQYSMDDSAKAEAFGAQTLQETGKRMYWLASDMFQLAKKEVEKRRAIEFSYARAQAMKEAAKAAQDALQAGPEKAAEIWEQSKQKVYSTIRNTLKDDEVAARFDEWWSLHSANLDIEVSAGIVERQNDIAIGKFVETATMYANEGNIDELKNLFADDAPPPGMKYSAYKKMQSEYMRSAIINAELAKIQSDPQNYKLPEPNEYLDQKDIEYLEGQKNSEIRQIKQAFNQQSEDLAMDMIASYEETGRLKYSASDWTRFYREGKINASWYTRGLSFIEEVQKALTGKATTFTPEQEAVEFERLFRLAIDPTTDLASLKAEFSSVKNKFNTPQYKEIIDDLIKGRSKVVDYINQNETLEKMGIGATADAVLKKYGLNGVSKTVNNAFKQIDDMVDDGIISPKDAMIVKTDIAELAKVHFITATQENIKAPVSLEEGIMNIIKQRILDKKFNFDAGKRSSAVKHIASLYYDFNVPEHLKMAQETFLTAVNWGKMSNAQKQMIVNYMYGFDTGGSQGSQIQLETESMEPEQSNEKKKTRRKGNR